MTADPRLTAARLWLAIDAGFADSVEVELRRIEGGGAADQADALLIRRCTRSRPVTSLVRRSATGIDPGGGADLTVHSLLIGVTAWQGALDRARCCPRRGRLADRDREPAGRHLRDGCRALVSVLDGAQDAAAEQLAVAQVLAGHAGDRHFVAAFPALARARLLLHTGDRPAAAQAAADAVRLAERGAGRVERAAALVTAARANRQAVPGDPAKSSGLVARARALLRDCRDPGPVVLAWLAAETSAAPPTDRPATLTEREIDILAMLPGPMTQRDLAAALFVSQNTLKTHLRAIYRKLGARSRADAVLRARQAGLL